MRVNKATHFSHFCFFSEKNDKETLRSASFFSCNLLIPSAILCSTIAKSPKHNILNNLYSQDLNMFLIDEISFFYDLTVQKDLQLKTLQPLSGNLLFSTDGKWFAVQAGCAGKAAV